MQLKLLISGYIYFYLLKYVYFLCKIKNLKESRFKQPTYPFLNNHCQFVYSKSTVIFYQTKKTAQHSPQLGRSAINHCHRAIMHIYLLTLSMQYCYRTEVGYTKTRTTTQPETAHRCNLLSCLGFIFTIIPSLLCHDYIIIFSLWSPQSA